MFGAGNEQLSDLKRYQDICAIEIKLSAAEMRGKKFDRINRMEAMHPRHAQKGSNPFLATYGIQLAFTRKLKSYMPPSNKFAKLSLINRVPLLEPIVTKDFLAIHAKAIFLEAHRAERVYWKKAY